MRLARKLALLATMAIAALALTATSASAQIEVIDTNSQQHCSPGPVHCEVLAHGEVGTVIQAHLLSGPEVTTSVCEDEFEAEINEDGEGQIEHQILTGASCPNKPCEATSQISGDGHPWPVHLREDPVTGEESLAVHFCLEPAGGGTQSECEINVHLDETAPSDYEFVAGDETCTGNTPPAGVRAIEVTGEWHITGTPITVVHTE